MIRPLLAAALAASAALAAAAANTAALVLDYQPGSNPAAGYTNTAALLGEPSRVTPAPFGGPVDPFTPPWQPGQLLSLGAGGSVTVQFALPFLNDPLNPFGLDFQIFGSAGFVITNGDFTGGGITDGSLFSANPGATRVSASADGVTYYVLNPGLAPTVDAFWPTDGQGDFTKPVNPALTAGDFAGDGLAEIRAHYAGAGGGAGFDLAWARDGADQPVNLPAAQYVRIEVVAGRAEVDGLVAVVPEPGAATLAVLGGLVLLRRRRSAR
jgi:MYXO-CTERM domain-containing protein